MSSVSSAKMTRKLLIVELDTVRDQVTTVIKDSFEKALDLIAEDIRTKHGFSSEASIQGLREQITGAFTSLHCHPLNVTELCPQRTRTLCSHS